MATKRVLPPSISSAFPKTPISASIKSFYASQRQSRKYHSDDHPPPPSKFTTTESLILSSAYPYIHTHGFTLSTLALGAKDAGYIDASVNLFPKGAIALVEWHLDMQRRGLAEKAEKLWTGAEGEGRKVPGVGGKVKELTWERLMANREVISRWQEALALLAQPTNIPLGIRSLAELSDEIWYLAGDVSVDTSWYTKRASLSAIYAASELFMTTDGSVGYRETREFMERRFEDGKFVGGAVSSLGEWVAFQGRAAVNVARSKGARI